MIRRLLIANRGEIACRIIQTAQRLGIHTIAVYSDIDEKARHVEMADEAHRVGGASPNDSYLCADRVLAIAKQAHADAIHPGYGFLSENAAFSRDCQTAGILFVGPSAEAIEAMGSKSRAKAIMQAAGVPIVPGYHADDQSDTKLLAEAMEIGFPVLLKAAAGGGGKGMRRVDSKDAFSEALASARREAKASFGDDHMLIEKCLLTPRHIEVQLMCDQQGSAIYIGDRDCSVQRRHQKVIEEAPAPGLSDETRRAMGEAAVAAAKAIQYCGAGTIEFLYQDGAFYFMEMNTRLQVEHPVTEAISGLDLVELQLAVAAGEPLPIVQSDVVLQGHAIELRVYAEDPDNDFLPASGTLHTYVEPPLKLGGRIDSGVRSGDEVSPFYDPMMAKVISHGSTRLAAIKLAKQMLSGFNIDGVKNNVTFLYRVLSDEEFQHGEVSTAFLNDRQSVLTCWQEVLPLGALMALYQCLSTQSPSLWFKRPGARLNLPVSFQYRIADQEWQVVEQDQQWHVRSEDFAIVCSASISKAAGTTCLSVGIDGMVSRYNIQAIEGGLRIFGAQSAIEWHWPVPEWQAHDAADDNALLAPMNGRVIACNVASGTAVAQGQTLLVMEAMKMEYALKAPHNGVVLAYLCEVGDLVEGGQLLVDFVNGGE